MNIKNNFFDAFKLKLSQKKNKMNLLKLKNNQEKKLPNQSQI